MNYVPPTIPRETAECRRCHLCHPGRQFGGYECCTRPTCTCHRREERR